VSKTVSRGREAGQQAEVLAAGEVRGSRGRRRWAALGIVAVVAAGVVSAWRVGAFSPAASSGAGQRAARAAGDGGGDPAGYRGNHAGDRDAGVCRVLTRCGGRAAGR
jgi:hypothetical protein